jgi:hypothetical protein
MKKKTIEDLERLAEEIGTAGAQNDLAASDIQQGFAAMTKGFTDAIGSLTAMLKGGKPPPSDDEPDDDEPDDDEDDEPGQQAAPTQPPPRKTKAPAQDPDAGYTDMQLGADADEFLDVEDLVRDCNRSLKAALAREQTLIRDNQRMLKALENNNALLRQVLETQVATTAPLLKGLQTVGGMLTNIPAGSIIGAGRAPAENPFYQQRAVKGKLGTLDSTARSRVMLKAMTRRVISDLDVARWNQTGAFVPDDEATNAKVVEAVEALI